MSRTIDPVVAIEIRKKSTENLYLVKSSYQVTTVINKMQNEYTSDNEGMSVRNFAEVFANHYGDVRMGAMASKITSLTVVYSIVYWGADQRRPQRSASLAFVWGIHRWPVNCPHKRPVTRKMFPFDDVIMHRLGTDLFSSSVPCFVIDVKTFQLLSDDSIRKYFIWYFKTHYLCQRINQVRKNCKYLFHK